ncbi:MAG: hypothetical protein H7A40_03255 [Chlamydiales bacterium]|nr:hypothetical protein [Chlamydiales bacterium]
MDKDYAHVYQRVTEWLNQNAVSLEEKARADELVVSKEFIGALEQFYQQRASQLQAEELVWQRLKGAYGQMLRLQVAGGSMVHEAHLYGGARWIPWRNATIRERYLGLFAPFNETQRMSSLNNVKDTSLNLYHLRQERPFDPWLANQIEAHLLTHLDCVYQDIVARNAKLVQEHTEDKEYHQNILEGMIKGHATWHEWLSAAYDDYEQMELDGTMTPLCHCPQKNQSIYDWIIMLQKADNYPCERQMEAIKCDESIFFTEGDECRWENLQTDEIWTLIRGKEGSCHYQIQNGQQIVEKGDFSFKGGEIIFYPEAVEGDLGWTSSRIKLNGRDYSLTPSECLLAFKYLFLPLEISQTLVKETDAGCEK